MKAILDTLMKKLGGTAVDRSPYEGAIAQEPRWWEVKTDFQPPFDPFGDEPE